MGLIGRVCLEGLVGLLSLVGMEGMVGMAGQDFKFQFSSDADLWLRL